MIKFNFCKNKLNTDTGMIFEATILKITCFQAIFEFSNFCGHMPGCSWNAALSKTDNQ